MNRTPGRATPFPLLLSLLPPLVVALFGSPVSAQENTLLSNGGFEAVREAKPDAEGLVSGWTLGDPPRVPDRWSLNSAYPGALTIGDEAAHSGERFVRIAAPPKGSSHLFQMCKGLEGGAWYRVSAWVRGGPLVLHFYEYFADAPIGGHMVLQGSSEGDEWRRLSGYYQPGGDGYLRSALAIYTHAGHSVEVDDVAIEPLSLPDIPVDAADMTFENDLLRVTITARGVLGELRCKQSGEDYSIGATPFPILTALRAGITTPVHLLTRDGDTLRAQFLDPDVRATLRIVPRPRHFLIEVLDIQPGDVEQLTIEFPVKRLSKVGAAFNATYDEQFGACLFGTTVNARNLPIGRGSGVRGLRGAAYRSHGIAGARFALIGAPADEFKPAIMEAERDNGLPCPILDGEWARDSDAARRSYLFGVDVTEANIDTYIDYAKVGGFRTIIILKGNWLANHGHFDINKGNFPSGREGLKRAVRKIHTAGLHAGVHVFGPSISPNDPYITPAPDDRLAFVACPPLAESIDASATALMLTGQPDLPPKTVRTRAFPNYYLRIGDEIIRYSDAVEIGPPFRFLDCQRGALGTTASAHAAGAEVKGLLAMWGFLLPDPDSTLAEEVTRNFADVFNQCDFDMVYFDASDGVRDEYIDRWYYLNKMHLSYYEKFKRDVLYQTSTGTGRDILWHIVPRSASADGHGDIKGYLDNRWPGIRGMADNLTKADIGWYYWFRDVRPDQIEYVCAKAIGVDGSISLETSIAALEKLRQSRQMMEMIARYEHCRAADHFPATVKAKLLEPGKDFKLFGDGEGGWTLYRAAYEEPRAVDVLDGEQNVWTITNDAPGACLLGAEIIPGTRPVPTVEYGDAGALTIESFDEPGHYALSERNQFAQFAVGGGRVLAANGPVRNGVTQAFTLADEEAKIGENCVVYSAQNEGDANGWSAIGRRFEKPLDLGAYKAAALWIHGDGKGETVRIQFRDSAGRHADLAPVIDFTGWRLCAFPLPTGSFDWSRTEYLLFYFNGIPAKTSVRVVLDDLRALPALRPSGPLGRPVLEIGDRRIAFPEALEPGRVLTAEGPGGVTLWPGGMTPGRKLDVPAPLFRLDPGDNTVTFSSSVPGEFPGDVSVLLYRMWPMEGEM